MLVATFCQAILLPISLEGYSRYDQFGSGALIRKLFLRSLRIFAFSALKGYFNAENAEVPESRREDFNLA